MPGRSKNSVTGAMLAGTGLILMMSLWQYGIKPGSEIVFIGAFGVFLLGFTMVLPREVPGRE